MEGLLIPAGSSLASLQLVQVPTTDIQIPLILIHTAGEVLDVRGTWPCIFVGTRLLCTVGVVELARLGVIFGRLLVFLLLGCRRCRRSAEETTDGMTDRGADGYATVERQSSVHTRTLT